MATDFWVRFDSNSANNPSLNLTGAPAIQITFVAETPGGGSGDFTLDQPAPGVADPDTVVSIGGTTYSFIYELSGTLPTAANQGAGQVPDQLETHQIAIITVLDYPTAGNTARLFFLPNDSATQSEMNSFGNGAIRIQNVDTTPDPTGPVCFATGTLIRTPRGEVAVEDLRAGDLVETLDRGPVRIRWIDFSEHRWPGAPDKARPVRISEGAFGPGLPYRDLVVSPQHRVLLDTPEGEALGPAKGLTAMPRIRRMLGCRRIAYHHMLLDHHAVLWSNGLPTESFLPGPTAMRMIDASKRDAILDIIPALRSDPDAHGLPARRLMTVRETRNWAASMGPALATDRNGRNQPMPLVAAE